MSRCPTCGRRTPAGGCRRCARLTRAKPAAKVGAAARLSPRAGPPGSRPGPRIVPSGWRPTPLWVDEPDALRIDGGPSRPVPCPGCRRRLAAHGEQCKACVRAARARPTVTPARVGADSRLARPLGPPGSAGRPGAGVKPSGWTPINVLYLPPARFQVDRDRAHTFTLRAPTRPDPS